MSLLVKRNSKAAAIGEKIDPIPDPQQAITDYFKIKNLPKIAKKKPGKDKARITPLTDLIASRRHLTKTNTNLADSREQMKIWNQTMCAEWQQLEQRQLELHDSFLRFNNFVKENHDKRKRAENKIIKEQNIQRNRKDEIAKLEEQVKYLCSVEKDLDEKVKEYQIYKDFLAKATEETSDFTDIQDILSRYEMLAVTRRKLGEEQAFALASVQGAREQLTQATASQAEVIMQLHTQMAALRVRQDAARTSRTKWDNILAHVRAFAAEKAIEMQQVQNSCWDLYKTMCHIRKEPVSVAEWDTEHQLTYITRRIQQLSKVTGVSQKKGEKHQPASNAHTASSSIQIQ